MTPDCELFMEDPERHAAHGESCADCRRFADEMRQFESKVSQAALPERSIAPDVSSRLPVAPWEGASHRAWVPVLVALITVIGLAAGLMLYAGVSPVEWMRDTVSSSVAVGRGGVTMLRSAPQIFGDLSPAFRATIIIGFLVINALLIALLRRSLKGYDAPSR